MQVVLHTLSTVYSVLFVIACHSMLHPACEHMEDRFSQVRPAEVPCLPQPTSLHCVYMQRFLHSLQRLVDLCGACAADNGAAGVVEEVGQTAGSTDQQRLGPGERAARLASTCGEERGWVGCRRDGRRDRDSRGTSTMSSINDWKEVEEGCSGVLREKRGT